MSVSLATDQFFTNLSWLECHLQFIRFKRKANQKHQRTRSLLRQPAHFLQVSLRNEKCKKSQEQLPDPREDLINKYIMAKWRINQRYVLPPSFECFVICIEVPTCLPAPFSACSNNCNVIGHVLSGMYDIIEGSPQREVTKVVALDVLLRVIQMPVPNMFSSRETLNMIGLQWHSRWVSWMKAGDSGTLSCESE